MGEIMSNCICKTRPKAVEIPAMLQDEIENYGGFDKIISEIATSKIENITNIMKTATDKNRMKILYGLSKQRMCVCMLAELIDCSYPRCSYHISKLKDAGFVQSEKMGNYIIYSLTPVGKNIFESLIKMIT